MKTAYTATVLVAVAAVGHAAPLQMRQLGTPNSQNESALSDKVRDQADSSWGRCVID